MLRTVIHSKSNESKKLPTNQPISVQLVDGRCKQKGAPSSKLQELIMNSWCPTKKVLFVMGLFLISGCVTKTPFTRSITNENYFQKISISKANREYLLAEYIGPDENCFPPIQNRICNPVREHEFNRPILSRYINLLSDERRKNLEERKKFINRPIYKSIKDIDIERFSLSAAADVSVITEHGEHLLLLSAADLAVQRNYQYLIILNNSHAHTCETNYSTSTSGTINTYDIGGSSSGSYSGRTDLNEEEICHFSLSKEFLFLNDIEILKNGVFYRTPYSESDFDVIPEEELYLGTSEETLYSLDPVMFEDSVNYMLRRELRAWENVYNARGLSDDLRSKYNITNNHVFEFTENAALNSSPENDPLLKNKMK